MTRQRDVNVPLQNRPRIANEIGANVFISIHNNSWGKANSITGTTTYYHGKSAASRRLARCVKKEILPSAASAIAAPCRTAQCIPLASAC